MGVGRWRPRCAEASKPRAALFSNSKPRASLVVQWLRICLPMQGTRVRALVREDPTCRGATKPVPQLLSLRSRAREPRVLKPVCLEPMLCNKMSHHNKKPAHRNKEQPPAHHNQRKPECSNEDPRQPKKHQKKKPLQTQPQLCTFDGYPSVPPNVMNTQ